VGLVHGTHPVVVTYNGNGNFTGSTSPTLNQNIVYATNTVVAASQNPAFTNVPVTLTATVSYSSGTGSVSGQVDFQDVTNPNSPIDLGQGTVNGATGQASIQATFTTLGNHQIIAVYLGDNNFATSTSAAIILAVNGGSTTS